MSDKRLRYQHGAVHPDESGGRRVDLVFTFGGQPIHTSAKEEDSAGEPLWATALATLEAVERAVERRFTCVLVDLDRVSALGKELIAVLVNIDFDRRQFQLFGSCQILEREIDAAAKAALNATNRFVQLALRS